MAKESDYPRYTVSSLTAGIKHSLESGFSRIILDGEISGWKRYPSGHCYFTVKDDGAQISAVMFSSAYDRCKARKELKDGAKVSVFGNVTVYPPRGNYQMTVLSVKIAGVGDLMMKYPELKERLERAIGPEAKDVWASTFHSACVRILRRDIDRLGYSRNFTIYADDEHLKCVAAATNCVVHVSAVVEEDTTKDTEDDWLIKEVTGLNWDVQVDALIMDETDAGAVSADALQPGLEYLVRFSQTAGAAGEKNRLSPQVINPGQWHFLERGDPDSGLSLSCGIDFLLRDHQGPEIPAVPYQGRSNRGQP